MEGRVISRLDLRGRSTAARLKGTESHNSQNLHNNTFLLRKTQNQKIKNEIKNLKKRKEKKIKNLKKNIKKYIFFKK